MKFSSYIRKFRVIGCKVIYDYNGLLINGEKIAHIFIYWEARSHQNFLIYEENFVFFFISVGSALASTSSFLCMGSKKERF
jgi:hypothetical protein